MTAARSLHEILAGLTGNAATSGDLAAALRAGGHPDLPAELLAEAVISFADTAPAEIAEHLAPFVVDIHLAAIIQRQQLPASFGPTDLHDPSRLLEQLINPGPGDIETLRLLDGTLGRSFHANPPCHEPSNRLVAVDFNLIQ